MRSNRASERSTSLNAAGASEDPGAWITAADMDTDAVKAWNWTRTTISHEISEIGSRSIV